MLKLNLQYFGRLIQRANSWEKSLILERLRAGGEGVAEDEMVGWHHGLNGHEFEQTLGDGEGQGSLVCCRPRGHEEPAVAERQPGAEGPSLSNRNLQRQAQQAAP